MRNPILSTAAVLLPVALLWTTPTLALPLEHAVERAIERDDSLKASERRYAAMGEAAVADGALPDPEIIIGAEGVPVDDPFSADMMTMYKLGVRQRFPAGQSRSLAQQRSRSEAEAFNAAAQARRLEVARQTRLAWLDWVSAAQSLSLARDSASAFEQLLEITTARYRSGSGRQRDINQARLELALLERRIIQNETRLDQALADLQRWTGPLEAATPPSQPPQWPEPASGDLLEQQLTNHPQLIIEQHRIEAGRIDTRLVRQSYRPQWMIEAGYAHQRGTDPMSMQRQSDKLFAMVSFSVPLFTGNRQDRRLAAANAQLQALEHDRGSRLQSMTGQLHRQLSLWQRNQQHLRLIDDIVLVEAEATVEATLSAYRSDRANFDELIRARLALLQQQLERIDIRRDRDAAAIELDYLTAGSLL